MEFINWLEQSWIYLAGCAAAISLLLGLRKSIKEIKDILNKPLEDLHKEMENRHQNDPYVIESLKCILRQDILDQCEKAINDGYISMHRLETLLAQYDSYHAMRGNSFCHELIDDVKKLPIK